MTNTIEKESMLISAAQKGDQRATEMLIENYQGLLHHICNMYFLKDGEKDDLFQEALIGFVQAIEAYRPEMGKQFKNFAYLCVKRELDSCVKRSNRKKHMVLNDALLIDHLDDDDEQGSADKSLYFVDKDASGNINSPEHVVIERETFHELLDKIGSLLSKMELNVLIMRMMGLSYDEITLSLQLENKSVDNAIQRIRKKITPDHLAILMR